MKTERPAGRKAAPRAVEKGAKARRAAPSVVPIVGIGASAGGLNAIEAFLHSLPPDLATGLAYVIVQHLDPERNSILLELVRQYTHLPTLAAADGLVVEPDHVYVMPRNTDLAVFDGRLQLLEPSAPRGLRLPIDYFFRSLAQDQGDRAVAVVLSGTGMDGTAGVKAIKGEGGTVMVQAPETAGYDGMPRSAIATGLADFVLAPADMPAQLLAFTDSAFHGRRTHPGEATQTAAESLQKVLVVLRDRTGHDFSHYKQSTVRRRVERRMAVAQIEHFDEYVRYIRKQPDELETLFRELLIGVTMFFREPAAFDALADKVLAPLVTEKREGGSLRAWVPACSTGEEAYSIAILVKELVDRAQLRMDVQVFATDIDESAIEAARGGVYAESIAADIGAERLERFFTRDGSSYRVVKGIRDLLVFAKQDVIKDPPFSRVDLVSCRNLLIYMDGDLQRRVLTTFDYALAPGGYLFLGNSESVSDAGDRFTIIDKKSRIYRRRSDRRPAAAPAEAHAVDLTHPRPTERPAPRGKAATLREEVESELLAGFAPPCVVVDAGGGDVIYIHGRVGKYLEPPPGEATSGLVRMARPGIRRELSLGLRKARAGRLPARYEGLRVQTNGDTVTVNVELRALRPDDPGSRLIMVLFEDAPEPTGVEQGAAARGTPDEARLAELERELAAKEDYLQTAVEELETSNEELQSTNEELQSANEELQSANEELETSREELQSINEELVTVNNELQQKIDELSRANNDMNNLLAGTGIATIFVDESLLILRFTPDATKMISLIKTDIGRPVSDIASLFVSYDDLIADIRGVLATLQPKDAEVQTTNGQWYLMRIQPYRTIENYIEGAVITFVEITRQHELQEESQQLAERSDEDRLFAEVVLDAVDRPVLTLDAELRIVTANGAFLEMVDLSAGATIGAPLLELGNSSWADPDLRTRLADVLDGGGGATSLTLSQEVAGRPRMLAVTARPLHPPSERHGRLLVVIEDVTASGGG